MVSHGQLSMFRSDASAAVLPLPEHLNYGINERGLHRIPGICGLYYHCAFLDEHAQRALSECIDTQAWRTDLERRVQHYGWRYDYRTRTVTPDIDLGPLPGWIEQVAARLHAETGLFDRVPDQAIVNEYQPGQGIALHADRQCSSSRVATSGRTVARVRAVSAGPGSISTSSLPCRATCIRLMPLSLLPAGERR